LRTGVDGFDGGRRVRNAALLSSIAGDRSEDAGNDLETADVGSGTATTPFVASRGSAGLRRSCVGASLDGGSSCELELQIIGGLWVGFGFRACFAISIFCLMMRGAVGGFHTGGRMGDLATITLATTELLCTMSECSNGRGSTSLVLDTMGEE